MKVYKPGAKSAVAAKPGEAMNDDQKKTASDKRNSTLIILIALICGVNYYKIDGLEKKQSVVIVPYGATSADMMLTGASANSSYVTGMLRLIVGNYGTVSRGTIDAKFAELLGMVYPDRSEGVREKLEKRKEYFKSFNSVSELRELMTEIPRVMTDNPEKLSYKTSAPNIHRVSFTANVKKIIGDSFEPDKPEKMYVDYTIADGRFWILDIN